MSVRRRLAGFVKRRSAEPERVPVANVEPAADQEAEAQPQPRAVVNERSARALLASGTPPLPPKPAKPPERRSLPATQREPLAGEAREWNIWELERAARAEHDHERRQEWSALLIHLREFANAEGNLPVEFDALVRESFADVLEPETAAT